MSVSKHNKKDPSVKHQDAVIHNNNKEDNNNDDEQTIKKDITKIIETTEEQNTALGKVINETGKNVT